MKTISEVNARLPWGFTAEQAIEAFKERDALRYLNDLLNQRRKDEWEKLSQCPMPHCGDAGFRPHSQACASRYIDLLALRDRKKAPWSLAKRADWFARAKADGRYVDLTIGAAVVESPPTPVSWGGVAHDPIGTRGASCVYRLYSHDGALVYVGVAYLHRRFARIAEHATDCWWPKASIDLERTHWTDYPTRQDALIAEAKAIRDERPRCNRTYTRSSDKGTWSATRRWRGYERHSDPAESQPPLSGSVLAESS
jgi:hypothetical protein